MFLYMALSIKDPETDRLARAVAARAGETMTEAIRRSLELRLEEMERFERRSSVANLIALRAISDRGRKRPDLHDLTEDEILGYGPDGYPV